MPSPKRNSRKDPRRKSSLSKRGPEPFSVDWEEFSRLASYQCTQLEIADWFGVHISTLENACERDFGIKLSVLWEQKKGLVRLRLKKIQWGIAEGGSTGMAIFLGKNLMGQSDQPTALQEAIQRSGLSEEQVIELINRAGAEAAKVGKVTFDQFCLKAGYPTPFKKQIEMVSFIMEEEEPRLLLGSRGYGKTDYAVILAIAYEIYVDPFNARNLIVTKSTLRNASMLEEIKNACMANGVQFIKANTKYLRVNGLVGKDHSVEAITLKGSLRGRHPYRVLMDDPVTEDDTSDAVRALVLKKYSEIHKLTSNIAIIGQPAHKFDLYAKLRKTIKTMEVPHGSIPELDHDLVAQRLAGVDESSIQASYFLEIADDGNIPFAKLRFVDKFPMGGSAVAFIDPSHEGGDFTAIAILTAYLGGIAIVGFAYKKAWNHCLDDMVAQMLKFGVKRVAFETNALGDQPLIMLRELLKTSEIGVIGMKSTTHKHSRIMAAGSYAHLLHMSKESNKAFRDQTVEYEYGAKNDDAPDAIASGLKWLGLIRGKE